MRHFAIALMFLLAVASASERARKEGVSLQFVPPPIEGTISMGIFDAQGRLVRVLHREAEEADFIVGLNGLITFWDGKDDAGQLMPAGKYRARGYMVEGLTVDGESFRFNDWIHDPSAPRIRRMIDVEFTADGALVLLAQLADESSAVIQIDPAGEIAAVHRLPAQAESLAIDGGKIFAAGKTEIAEIAGEGRISRWSAKNGEIHAVAADDDMLLINIAHKLQRFRISDRQLVHERAVGRPFEYFAGPLRGTSSGAVWSIADEPRALELPSLANAADIAFSRDTLWVIDGSDVKAFSSEGDFQRQLATGADQPAPSRIAASPVGETIALLQEDKQRQLLRVLTRSDRQSSDEGVWEIALQKQIIRSDELEDVVELLASGDGKKSAPRETVLVSLVMNPLTKKRPKLELMVGQNPEGSFIKTLDGLPLRRVSDTSNLRWTALTPAGNGLTIFQSDGAVVEEFIVRDLKTMMSFDCGEFDFDPQK